MNTKEILKKVDELIKANDSTLVEYLKECPAHGHRYVECKELDINIELLKIRKIVLTMSYLLSK